MLTLTTSAEIKALKAREYKAFTGISLEAIKSNVAEIAQHIGKNGIFDQYTRHDISHIDYLLKSLDKFIPKSTADKMTAGDWLMLVLSIYFHDLGMTVTKDEYENREKSSFNSYKDTVMNKPNSDFKEKVNRLDDPEKFLYQEFVRAKHAERVKNWIEGNSAPHLGVATVVFEEVNKMLLNLDEDFRTDLAMICESHHLNDLDNFTKYAIHRDYGTDDNEHVNLHYCAIMLRTADLLHITTDRTPSIEYRLINPSDPISQDEWAKQHAVKNVAPQKMRNEENQIDKAMQSNVIEITARFKGPEGAKGFFGLSSYLSYANEELKKNYEWSQQAQKVEGSEFDFPWNKIDDSKISTKGFEPKQFEFTLDQTRILKLLVGHTLYNDSTVIARELVQNSIDAIKLQAHVQKEPISQIGGEVRIKWDTKNRILSIMDNGTGMSHRIIEEHLLKVGSSRYQSDDFKKQYPDFTPISRFGIGILTCFLIADNIEIITSHNDDEEARKLTIRHLNGKYLLQHLNKREIDPYIQAHGTIIRLETRANIKLNNLLSYLNGWIVFPICPVTLTVDDNPPISVGFESPKYAVEAYLKHQSLDRMGNIKVCESTIDGITVAYALRYSPLFKEWGFINYNSSNNSRDNFPASLGTCIEGILVEPNSPGFIRGSNHGIVAMVNASGEHAPKTNVARSNIERSVSEEHYLKVLYSLYMKHVIDEVMSIQKEHSFSMSWAADEVEVLLYPLLSNHYRYNNRDLEGFINPELFKKELRKANLVLIEKEKRFMTSIDEIEKLEDIWIVDSSLFSAAESLLKEGDGSASLLELIRTLNPNNDKKTSHLDSILCKYRPDNFMQNLILSERFVRAVKIFPIERRVDICWSKHSEQWSAIRDVQDIDGEYGLGRTSRTYFIQHENHSVQDAENFNIIECFNFVFILKNSPIWNFFNQFIDKIDVTNNRLEANALEFMLAFMHSLYDAKDNQSASVSYSADSIKRRITESIVSTRRYSGKYSPEVVAIVEQLEYIKALTSTVWQVFTPSAWHRIIGEF